MRGFRFAHVMKIGDADYCNIQKVKWLKRVPRIIISQDALHSFGGFSTVATSDDYSKQTECARPAIAGVLVFRRNNTIYRNPIRPLSFVTCSRRRVTNVGKLTYR